MRRQRHRPFRGRLLSRLPSLGLLDAARRLSRDRYGHLYRICDAQTWAQAEGLELLPLSPLDERDGFVHLSTATQVRNTLRRFFGGREDLVLLTISSARLVNGSLRYEAPSKPDAEVVVTIAPSPCRCMIRPTACTHRNVPFR